MSKMIIFKVLNLLNSFHVKYQLHITCTSLNKVARFRLASISSINISNNVDLEPKFFEHFSSRANIEPKNFEPISSRATFDHLNFRAERVDLRACNGSFTSLGLGTMQYFVYLCAFLAFIFCIIHYHSSSSYSIFPPGEIFRNVAKYHICFYQPIEKLEGHSFRVISSAIILGFITFSF